ncbi:AbrB/MazE/SpoVT family DNA-binding domain-containing protein [Secundilactobacillus malefermentans]|uniref:SpoVT-AbrB domain-containing protein n=2 Tax=Secundilactobacillus malefermentans TaxID=176292 RepID=A0A4R5NEV0_9LACO|nr:AbrB/MazE/SpoVT family DNA-binding domain-containing protein [Secundilactobacillus malefermentans]QEA31304.1 AbrB/MazE/SpoVT family DNA-binding domain-containing protein [Secundilactobacillus malefermentans]TDG72119.1 hypothetical protein C5L31_001593 [Secundilactobacillus malefermentans]
MMYESNKQFLSKVTAKGQITIPKAVRDDLGIDTDSKLRFIQNSADSYLMKVEETDSFWNRVNENVAQYGPIDDSPEIDWGPDVGAEVIDYYD